MTFSKFRKLKILTWRHLYLCQSSRAFAITISVRNILIFRKRNNSTQDFSLFNSQYSPPYEIKIKTKQKHLLYKKSIYCGFTFIYFHEPMFWKKRDFFYAYSIHCNIYIPTSNKKMENIVENPTKNINNSLFNL